MRGGRGRSYCRTQLRYLISSSRHNIMSKEIPHCALMRRSGGCHFGHFGGGHGDPPPATQCWMLGWGGSRTPIKYYGGFPPPSGLEVIVGREPNHQQCWKSLWGGSRTTSNLDVELSALPRPPQPPRGGNATARRGPTHKSHAVFGGCRLDVSKTKPYST